MPTIGIKFPEVPILGSNFPDFFAGILALSINSGAYVAEIIRAGIQAVDKGQMEAARSLGMSESMAMKNVIIPQAFKNILPALGNEFITIIKESSIVSIIGIHELMYNADTVRGNIFRPFEPLLVAALMYFILTFTLSKLLGVAERRMRVSDRIKNLNKSFGKNHILKGINTHINKGQVVVVIGPVAQVKVPF